MVWQARQRFKTEALKTIIGKAEDDKIKETSMMTTGGTKIEYKSTVGPMLPCLSSDFFVAGGLMVKVNDLVGRVDMN